MFSVEVSIMLKQLVRIPLSRLATAATALVFVLVACSRVDVGPSGYLEVFPNRFEEAPCDAAVPGQLQLEGVGDDNMLLVSGEQLCKSRFVTRELPAGLYSVSWQPSIDDAEGERWVLRGPSIVSVFSGQVTRLRLRQIASDRPLLSRAP
jgi:hypothetical protein